MVLDNFAKNNSEKYAKISKKNKFVTEWRVNFEDMGEKHGLPFDVIKCIYSKYEVHEKIGGETWLDVWFTCDYIVRRLNLDKATLIDIKESYDSVILYILQDN